jgi:hypothetical protein
MRETVSSTRLEEATREEQRAVSITMENTDALR